VEYKSFEEFVERLYTVALNRTSDPEGKKFWCKEVVENGRSGADCARYFLLDAPEFMNRKLSTEDFVETLYKTFFDRKSDAAGKYYMINQGLMINDKIAEPGIVYLLEDQSVVCEDGSGTWTLEEGTNYMAITIGDKTYSGVFAEQKDLAGNDVFVFTAVGANESVWGVRYSE